MSFSKMEQYREIILGIESISKKVKEHVPDEFSGDKHEIFRNLREAGHWVRDVFEMLEMRENPPEPRLKAAKDAEKSSARITESEFGRN